MEKWLVYAKKADFQGIARKYGIDQVTARIIRNRDITEEKDIELYLRGTKKDLLDPMLLPDMDKAAAIMKEKIRQGASIRIMGDYDIDGVMSSYILKRGLTEMGGHVSLRIPERIKDGYGLNIHMIEEAVADGVDTIVTCDNGIAAGEAIACAKEHGMTVVVTDHHEVLAVPPADAVVDQKRPDDTYPNKNICGAGLAWKLILAMGGDPEMKLLPYAAFATVGDVVDLTGENRVLVKEGIRMLRQTDNLGLLALARAQKLDLATLNSYHIGFVLGPCFNASGRLDTALRAERLLEADTENEATQIARELKDLNDSRKAMTDAGVLEAEDVIARDGLAHDPVMVVFLPDAHESIAGIIAGRIREKYGHPTFVLTRAQEEGCVKGSGRSIPEYSMFEELVKVKDLLLKFGGHPMAAGLSLAEGKVDDFRKAINANSRLTEEDLKTKIHIDVPMPLGYISEDLIRDMAVLEPFGKGNEKPVFAESRVLLTDAKPMGSKGQYLRMKALSRAGGPAINAVCFRDAEALAKRIAENPYVSIIYDPQINEWRGRRPLQIVISHFQ
ncbi:MAG: single-stranded-DNA-specific exonuclease RecJ [Lachnospiraceae bacterium]|nr:single-stranded-DNA-specific exonuclease RecJ [Lachnospiraceae bacterium]